MALIPKQDKRQRTHVQVRLGDDVLADLDRYCRFIESARDYVVENILAFAFKKDRDFQEWLAANPTAEGPKPQTAPAQDAFTSTGSADAPPTTAARRRVAATAGPAGEAA